MARQYVKNPGKTAKYYRSNPEAREKHRAAERKRNKSPAKRAYHSLLIKERRKRGIYGKGGPDMSHKGGKIVARSPKKIEREAGLRRNNDPAVPYT